MEEFLRREHGLLEHYRSGDADLFSRLGQDVGSEAILDYYLERVGAESGSGQTVRLRVRAFSSAVAAELATAILEATETRLNDVVTRPLREQKALAASLLEYAGERLAAAEPAAAEQGASPSAVRALERAQNAYDEAADRVEHSELELLQKKALSRAYQRPFAPGSGDLPAPSLGNRHCLFRLPRPLHRVFSPRRRRPRARKVLSLYEALRS